MPATAPTSQPAPTTTNLWPARAPLATGDGPLDTPTLTIHQPADDVKKSGGCVLVCPGGGYQGLAPHEGKTIGEFFAAHGITAGVLKYRLGPKYHNPAQLKDVSRGLRTLRHRAGELRIDPHKIAVMGFSAGGHLASTLSTHFDNGDPKAADPIDREPSRPDAAILCYPVITLRDPFAHAGSRRMLLGDNPTPQQVDEMSSELHVTDKTPPTFIWHTVDDEIVPFENAMMYAAALKTNKVPFELHAYEHGHHGLGLAPDDPRVSTWSGLMLSWLATRGW